MSRKRTGDLKLIQELNRSIIFETIRKYGPISRSEIAKKNHISPTTVTSAVNELIRSGFVQEGKPGASRGGRKPILVHFSPNSRFIIGVSITNSMVAIGKLNLQMEVCSKQTFSVGSYKGEALIDYLLDLIDRFLQTVSDLDKCIGISIVTPGIVDYESGIIRYNSHLMLKDVPLKERVEARCNLNVWMDNDSNAVALAEKEIGDYNEFENIFYIIIGDGVGAGIVLSGKVFRGYHGGAAEFGHTIVERGGIRCECGNKGCLEKYVGWPAIYSRIISSIAGNSYTNMTDMVDGELSDISPSVFLKALEGKDRLALNIMEDTASYLSTGIINIVNLFNPDLILLGGEVARENHFLMERVNELVAEQALKTNMNGLKICSSSLGKDFELISAANLVLHDQFQFSLSG